MNERNRMRLLWTSVVALLLLGDRLSKLWVQEVLRPAETMPLLPGFIRLCYAENTGAAFSAFSGATVFLSLLSIAVCIGIAAWLLYRPQCGKLLCSGLSAVLAGGAGNLIDRISYGYVVDFLELQFIRFAIFNVADICITVGAGLIFIALLVDGREKNGRVDS